MIILCYIREEILCEHMRTAANSKEHGTEWNEEEYNIVAI